MQRLTDNKLAVGATLAAGLGAAYFLLARASSRLTGGSIAKRDVAAAFDAYTAKKGATGTASRPTSTVVDSFYSMVSDLYEMGWGTSFHFSPPLPSKSAAAAEAAHEARLGAILAAGPGHTLLDVGCGIGGPMRVVAATTGANVTGITINEHQVKRAAVHNDKAGLAHLCTAVRGDFNAMPFPDSSLFDGAYAVEATCHASALESIYGEVFRVLKPGARFVSFEWVTTPAFDPTNPDHVRTIDEINFGNGLPEMRSAAQAEAAGRAVGFVLERSLDLASFPVPGAGHWYSRLKKLRDSGAMTLNRALVNTAATLRLAPAGLKPVHDMLCAVATSLVAGGEAGIFTPCHMLVFRKPDDAAAAAAVAAVAPVASGGAAPAALA